MKPLALVVVSVIAGACTKQNTPSGGVTPDARITELTLLMKNDINPAFSKLTFLLFHGEAMEEDPKKLRAELSTAAEALRTAIGQLRTWQEPPTESAQGRDVFYTYADNVEHSTKRLLDALKQRNDSVAVREMKQIANTCNHCHHFFRLKIEDSVVPDTANELELSGATHHDPLGNGFPSMRR